VTSAPESAAEPDFLYFGYGSNLDVERLHENCPSARLMLTARLAAHRLAFTRNSEIRWHGGVADILAEPGSEVWGAVWAIDGEHSHALDRQERLFRTPPGYERYGVTVTSADGEQIGCRSYRVVAPDPRGFAPSPAYKETILRGARALALPDHYIAALEAIEHNGDEDRSPA
jgi:gamma-glutamylcyclotransferase (GGCT)/AIG2-like uncharacterized protein YtfP